MKYRVRHRTEYSYAAPADACHNVLRLTPRTFAGQICLEHRLEIDPAPATLHDYPDYFGNQVRSFAIYAPHAQLTIASESLVEVARPKPPALGASESWEAAARGLRTISNAATVDALEYIFDSTYVRSSERQRAFAAEHFSPGAPILSAACSLAQRIHQEFKFDANATTIDTSTEDVLEKRHGVCQDFAHLQIGCLRSLGLACRYVSGYLRTDPAPGQPRLAGADASHAWVSVYSLRHGWIDFDPTNGCLADERHIAIGWGRDFHDISPVKGVVLGGGTSQLQVAVDVLPV